jgi:membrane protease YdiL (CAAX protease family)
MESRMNDQGFLRRHPIVPFVILVYVLPLPIMLLRFIDLPFEPLIIYASWTPNIAAFLVLRFILRERGGIKRLVSGWGEWRVGFLWYAAAISPLFVSLFVAAIYLILGGDTTPPEQPVVFPLLTSLVLSTITGAMGEELGWRGFLLPRLQRRFDALSSSLIVGVIWALWHLPLWLLPGYGWDAIPYWTFAIGAISTSVIMTWVLNNAEGSLVLASIIHLMMNYGLSVVSILGLVPSPRNYWMIASVLFAVYAVLVVLIAGPRRLSRRFSEIRNLSNHDL